MEQKIIETANKYKDMANMIEESAVEASFDNSVPGYIGDALIRLYYAKSLEQKLDKCQDFLDEDTEEQAFEAVMDADKAIIAAADAAFNMIEDYCGEDKDFSKMIDNISFNAEEERTEQLLYQLYKCEGIMRMAYRTAKRYPIYGGSGTSWEKLQGIDDTIEEPEDMIMRDTGIDIYKLQEVCQSLVELIGKKTGNLSE